MRFYLTAAVAVVLLCAANLSAGVVQKGACQKGDACQKGSPCQKGDACQKITPVQKAGGACQKGVACQKGPGQKVTCQKTPCQKGEPAAPDAVEDELVPEAPPAPEAT